MQILQEFDPARMQHLLAEKPEQYFQLAHSVTAQSRERTRRQRLELEFQKYRDQVAEAQRKLKEAVAIAERGLSPETIQKMREVLDNM